MTRANVIHFILYVICAAAVIYSISLSNQAISLNREIDHKGDVRACEQENLINRTSNARDAKLEQTARITVRMLKVISEARRGEGDDTNAELRALADEADKVQTSFKPAKIVDCEKVFPGPENDSGKPTTRTPAPTRPLG